MNAGRLWELAGGSAERHGLSAFFHAHPPDAAGPADRRRFAAAYRRTLAENMLFSSATEDVLSVLRRRGVQAVPLKGVFFALRFYGDIALRPQSDVDVLVRREDLDRAHGVLEEAGWREAWPRAFYADHYHWVYRRHGLLLELHWALRSPGACAPDLDRLWRSARPATAGDVPFLEWPAEDVLQYMAVNKGQQHFARLLDFLDVALVAAAPGLDWDLLARRALSDGTAGPVWFALACVRDWLGVSVPPPVLAALARPLRVRPAVFLKRFLDALGGPRRFSPERLGGPAGRIHEILLEGRPAAAARLLAPLLFPSRARRDVLAGGSFLRYYAGVARRLFAAA